jgi:predicted dehydrogenase
LTASPLTLAVLGCGRVVERLHLPAIRRCPEVRLVGAVEPDPARRGWAGQALDQVPVEASLRQLLGRVRPEAVLIATPPGTHAGLALAAIRAGCHVLVEKPLATTAGEAREVMAAAAAGASRLAVGFNRRFRRPYQAARALLQGQPFSLRARLVTDAARWPSAVTDADRRHRAMLEDVVPHLLDLVPWLARRPVQAVRADALPSGVEHGVAFTVRLAGGLEVPCTAGHVLRYEEGFHLCIGEHVEVARPWGLTRASSYGRAIERAQTAMHLVLPKLLRRPNLTALSIHAQLSAFVRACRGQEAGELAGPEAGLAAALALDALVASQGQGGRWIELNAVERE